MRSRHEILFRLKQETMNLRLFLLGAGHTRIQPAGGPLAGLPDPAAAFKRLRGTPYAAHVVALAEDVLKHRFQLLALEVEIPAKIDWQLDPTHPDRRGLAWRRHAHSRLIPYMDAERFGDYKAIWELNRLQHLPLLAQAGRFSGRRIFLDEIARELTSWRAGNRLMSGINWASALEAAFRVLSFIWTWHFVSADLDPESRRQLLRLIEGHCRFLEYNLSEYHSPNTHLIGEALALEAAGTLFPHFKHAARWKQLGRDTLDRELTRQILPDGGHFERSTYYHVYTLDMFLLHAVISQRRDPEFLERLRAMARYLAAVAGPARRIPLIGDDDGGRLFHPFGERDRFCRATLALGGAMLDEPAWIGAPEDASEIAAWWLGVAALKQAARAEPVRSELFRDTGIAVMAHGSTQIVMDAGPFAAGSGGHSHADTLSVIIRRGDEEILIDPGTYTYILDPPARDRFRGTAAHNTVRIDSLDQAVPAGPFRWTAHPAVEIVDWSRGADRDVLSAVCRYRGFCHARAVMFLKPGVVIFCDRVEGPAGEHLIEQFWHPGVSLKPEDATCLRLGSSAWMMLSPGAVVDAEEGGEFGWRSAGLGAKTIATCVRVSQRSTLPCIRWTVLDLEAAGDLTVGPGAMSYRRESMNASFRADVSGSGCIKLVLL